MSTAPADGAAARPLILIVEDDELAAFVFTRVLTSGGYSVVVSSGSPESLPELKDQRPAAMLIDLHLGEIDGIEFLRRLRTVRALRSVPAAVMTGDYFTDARVSKELESLGLDMHLKPIWDDELLRVISDLVRRSTGRRGPELDPPAPSLGAPSR